MTGVQLKALCKARGLKVAGTKAELQDRLRQHFCAPEDDLDTMSDQDLRDACAARGLKDNGKRPALMERIRMDIWYANELIAAQSPQDSDGYKSISEALEAAANKDGGDLKEILSEIKEKAQSKSKYIEVTITSIGLKPEKYTVGGAPSVTADVLRALAGDPFGDDPKYGTVSGVNSILLFLHDDLIRVVSLTDNIRHFSYVDRRMTILVAVRLGMMHALPFLVCVQSDLLIL
jgi:hypothetical protein